MITQILDTDYIQASDLMVGANHATLDDTLNRAALKLADIVGATVPLIDTVQYTYTDDQTVTLAAGGTCGTSDGLAVITLDADVVMTLTAHLTTGQTLAAGWWYIWIGQTAAGATIARFSSSANALPAEMVRGRRLTAGISVYYDVDTYKIRAFDFDGRYYRYYVPISLLIGTAPTTSTAVSLAAYAPADVLAGRLHVAGNAVLASSDAVLTWSVDGSVWYPVHYGSRPASVSYQFPQLIAWTPLSLNNYYQFDAAWTDVTMQLDMLEV